MEVLVLYAYIEASSYRFYCRECAAALGWISQNSKRCYTRKVFDFETRLRSQRVPFPMILSTQASAMNSSRGSRFIPNSGRDSEISPNAPLGYEARLSFGAFQQHSLPASNDPTIRMPASNDPTIRILRQSSHQNLSGAASPYVSYQPSSAHLRPRTAASGDAFRGGYPRLSVSSQLSQKQSWPRFQVASGRNPEKYGPVAQNNQKKCERLASDYFRDSVRRVRERNVR
jgi:hypothetical protein